MIDRIQDHLEAIYGTRCGMRAKAFVLDEETARRLSESGRAPEELWVCDEGEEMSLGLYFAPGLLERLSRYEGLEMPPRLLEEYCQLAEGVSHFVYLVLAASRERRVSLLELEAQAEVDKFASCLLQRWRKSDRRWPEWAEELHRKLFRNVSFRAGLSGPERDRYREANRLSGNYCRRLLRFARARSLERLLSELRYSYRLGAAAKLDYLAQPASI